MIPTEIDFHGVKHESVGMFLYPFIYEHIKRKSSSVSIITGNSPEMKKIVDDIVKEHGLESRENFGNSAVLIVDLL